MPELPDVEVFRRHLAATSLHKTIRRTSFPDARLLQDVTPQAVSRRLKDHELETTRRRGKYLFVKLSSRGWLVLHFGMTGFVEHLKEGQEPPEHTCMLIHFAGEEALAYVSQRKLGRISLADDIEEFAGRHDLGPDALELDWPAFHRIMSAKRGTVKGAFMDQSTLAGVGNVYSDELLFQAGLHPQRDIQKLDEHSLQRLFETMRDVLRTAINSHARPAEMPDNFLLPRRGELGPCPRCGGELKKISVSGRSAVFCPTCQSSESEAG